MDRDITLQLLKWKNNKSLPPLLIRGIKGVGKTWVVKDFGNKHFNNFIYIDFQSNQDVSKIFEPDLKIERIVNELKHYYQNPINEDTLIFFDEIQYAPRAFASLRNFNRAENKFYIICASSLMEFDETKEVFVPSGDFTTIFLYPLTFKEFLKQSIYKI